MHGKPYFSYSAPAISQGDANDSTNGSSNATAEGLVPVTSPSADLFLNQFSPPSLTPTHMRKPGCLHARSLDEKGKVLSPSDILFSKRGKENILGPSSLKKNKMEVTACQPFAHTSNTHVLAMTG